MFQSHINGTHNDNVWKEENFLHFEKVLEYLLSEYSLLEFKRRLHPNAVIPVQLNKESVAPDIIYNLLAFIFLSQPILRHLVGT